VQKCVNDESAEKTSPGGGFLEVREVMECDFLGAAPVVSITISGNSATLIIEL